MTGYYEYDLKIYPRKLWITWAITEEVLNNIFEFSYGKDKHLEIENDYNGVTFGEMQLKETLPNGRHLLGELVIFYSTNTMTVENIVHEASHITDCIEDVVGIKHGGEPSAYLIQYITKCIIDAKYGGKNADRIVLNNN